MKFRTAQAFKRDLDKLPPSHRNMFREAVYKHFLPAIDVGAFTGRVPWPPRGFAYTDSAAVVSTR